jgi:hypothetical protein
VLGITPTKMNNKETLRKNRENYELIIEENELKEKGYHDFINNNDTFI